MGSRLNVNELQGTLGVSCTPIREAINRLQLEGLIINETNIGARVLALDAHDIEEIQQLAMTLHCAAIHLAMERSDHAGLAQEVKKYQKEYLRAKSVQSEVAAVNQLVGVFYHRSGNRRLDKSMISLQGQQLLLRYIFAACRKGQKSEGDFAPLAQAVRSSAAEAVCLALRAYTDSTTPVILDYIREKGGKR
ncbi:GntR family transcriptional regulator [uncultured Oscillibacter sp.]|uniref:GntR family transcriptional regulator n=1 Tax=uncultured Oscillibacter sp. TaxID=876091 RepID=UPI0025D2A6FA|nr:GntR family transcriptional regulator [uncultured Oscillibacter sp.]